MLSCACYCITLCLYKASTLHLRFKTIYTLVNLSKEKKILFPPPPYHKKENLKNNRYNVFVSGSFLGRFLLITNFNFIQIFGNNLRFYNLIISCTLWESFFSTVFLVHEQCCITTHQELIKIQRSKQLLR